MAAARMDIQKGVAPSSLNQRTYGGTVYDMSGNTQPFSDVRTLTDGDVPAEAAADTKNKGIGNKDPFAILPPVVRAGTNNIESLLYKNRPVIEIIDSDNENTKTKVKYKYDQWILTSVQEQDAEKIDVIETFGEPHLFASGRFTRRYTFQGMLRTTPINSLSPDGPGGTQQLASIYNELTGKILRTPQTVLFRNFYDKYMRISEQAKQKTFTRITVDKEVYEGFVTTFNVARDSSVETTSPFVFTMVAFNRYHIDLDQPAVDIIKSTQKLNPVPVAKKAGEELKDAQPGTGLSTVPNRVNIGKQSVDNPDTSSADKQVIQLYSTNNKEMIFVSVNLPGIEIIYAHSFRGSKPGVGGAIHGTLLPQQNPVEITYRITNYWALYNSVLAQHTSGQPFTATKGGGQTSSTPLGSLVGNAIVTLMTQSGQETQLVLEFTLEPPTSVRVAKIQGVVSGMLLSQEPIVVPIGARGGQIHLGEARFNSAYDISNRLAMDIRFFIAAPDGSPIPPPTIQGATVQYDLKRVYPGFGTSLARVSNKADTDICNGSVITIGESTVPLPDNASFQQSINVTPLSPNKLLSEGNPFQEADHVVIELHPVVNLVGFPPATDLPNLLISVYQGASPVRESLVALSFLGAVWDPRRSTTRDGTNVSTRLDRFGYVNFLVTTSDGNDVKELVRKALSDSSLIYQTSFMRFGGFSMGSSATIDRIPLSGTGYGQGQAIDADTKETVSIRTRLASMTFDKAQGGLVLKIELNATHTSGVSANLYSDRFWQYLTDVKNAQLTVPPSAGVRSPVPWEK